MPLKGRVGRHLVTGRHCQNWKADQETVISFLNKIPASDGGAAGSLNGRIVAGYASTPLFEAIKTFEKKHNPGKVKGFVEPGELLVAKLEAIAFGPSPSAPKRKNQWDGLKTASVRSGVSAGLAEDNRLTHIEVVNIVRSVLSDGIITKEEVLDLRALLSSSKSMENRSRTLLMWLAADLDQAFTRNKPLKLQGEDQKFAAELVCKFMEGHGNPHWPGLSRDIVGAGLLIRVANPSIIDQNNASLCGPAAVMFGLAADRPGAYAKFAIDLYEKGQAQLGRNLTVSPKSSTRSINPGRDIEQVDWLTLGGLRSSENWLVNYLVTSEEVKGITTAWEMARWFGDAGYRDVREETNVIRDKGVSNLLKASELYQAGYRTALFIDAAMLDMSKQSNDTGIMDRHWVILTSKVSMENGNVNLKVYTYGNGEKSIPEFQSVPLLQSDFLKNYHGYVAGKP